MTLGEDATRTHPRFIHTTLVELRLEDRDELRDVWTRDISNGGLFVATDDPPPTGTRVVVGLRVPNAGTLRLRAEVVHVVTLDDARLLNCLPGAGLKLIDMTPEHHSALKAYVDGIASRFAEETGDLTAALERPGEMIAKARKLLQVIQREDLYASLGIDPTASVDEIDRHIQEIARVLSTISTASPQRVARVEMVLAHLNRIRRLLTDPERRLEYDLRHGHLRVTDRLADAVAGGMGWEKVRAMWRRMFPEKMREAERLAFAAQQFESEGNYNDAVKTAHAALELDPFNVVLRDAVASWNTKETARGSNRR